MPQTSSDVQAVIDAWFPQEDDFPWRTQDGKCLSLLLAKGWTEGAGILHPPTPSYFGPREDYILLKYLVEEWDYDYHSAPVMPYP